MNRKRDEARKRGSYTIEGAFTILIFTVCICALLSLLTIVKVEGEVQDALNQAALKLSQQSYGIAKAAEHTEGFGSGSPADLLFDAYRDPYHVKTGARASEAMVAGLVQSGFHRSGVSDWLMRQGVRGGMAGLRLQESQILTDGKRIVVTAVYQIDVNTYGLFEKRLTIRETAVVNALLPENARSLLGDSSGSGKDSIWKETPFKRGRYFMGQLKSGNPGTAVEPGHGIDLYDPASGQYTEGYSMNLFDRYYSSHSGAENDPNAYTPKAGSVSHELDKYARHFLRDVQSLPGSVEMTGGGMVKSRDGAKKMILTVPEEVQQNAAMQQILKQMAGELRRKYGIQMEVKYQEEALI